MFLPQTQDVVKHIKPAFTVSFVNIPTGPDIEPAPPAKPVVEKPIPQKAKSISEPKLIPKPKPIPGKSAASKALVSKLDQLAQLEKKKTIPCAIQNGKNVTLGLPHRTFGP